jgi:hypothetical protein
MLDTHSQADTIARPARNAVELIHQLKEAGEPIVLTINGKAELVVQDETSCQQLLDLVDRIETIEGLRIGLEEMKDGKGRPAEELFEELRQKYNLPRDA